MEWETQTFYEDVNYHKALILLARAYEHLKHSVPVLAIEIKTFLDEENSDES